VFSLFASRFGAIECRSACAQHILALCPRRQHRFRSSPSFDSLTREALHGVLGRAVRARARRRARRGRRRQRKHGGAFVLRERVGTIVPPRLHARSVAAVPAPGGAPDAGGGGKARGRARRCRAARQAREAAARKAQTAPNDLLKRSKIVVGNQRESAPVGPGVAFLGERAILEPNPREEGTQCVTTPWHTFLTDWP
jgi:hypothetical protein